MGGLAQAQRVADQAVVIENVTLISPERTAPLQGVRVVLNDGKIAEIGTTLIVGP
jgi:hypothetical protein